MVPSLHPIWALPLIAAGLGLAVWLASFLYVERRIKAPAQAGNAGESDGRIVPAV
jgi:hypothetical protein